MTRTALLYAAALIAAPVLALACVTLLDSQRLAIGIGGTALAGSSLAVLEAFRRERAAGPGGLAERKLFIVAVIMSFVGIVLALAGLLGRGV